MTPDRHFRKAHDQFLREPNPDRPSDEDEAQREYERAEDNEDLGADYPIDKP